jgi:hypothetical protein
MLKDLRLSTRDIDSIEGTQSDLDTSERISQRASAEQLNNTSSFKIFMNLS